MAYVTDVYFSEVLDKDVIDQYGKKTGILWDLTITPGVRYPCISKLLLKVDSKLIQLDIANLYLLNRFVVTVKSDTGEQKAYEYAEGDILIRKHILDKQILDVNGAKVVRVNDVKLGESEGCLSILGIDVGFKGILRRIEGGRAIEKITRVIGKPIKENIIDWNFLQSVDPQLKNLTLMVARRQLGDLHPSDLAAILTDMHPGESERLLSSVSEELAGEALHELPMEVREKILKAMDKERISDILEEMPPDEAADILGDMSEETSQELLSLMEREDATEVQNLLGYEEDTAGGLMTIEYLDFTSDTTVEEVIADLRLLAPEIDFVYYVYVLDKEDHLLGVVSLKKMLTSPYTARMEEIMTTNVKHVHLETEQKEIADMISKYDFIAIPVLDDEEKMKGVITVDDIFDLLVPNPTRRRKKGSY